MPRKTRKTTSKKTARKLPKLPAFNFGQVVRASWLKTVSPLRGAKIPADLKKLPLARNLTVGTAALLGVMAIGAVLLFFFGNNLVHAWQEKTAAAVVNGEVISKGTLERRLIQAYGDDTVQKIVDETLVFQEATKEKVAIRDTDVKAELDQVEKDIAPTKLDDALAARKMNRADLDRQIRFKLIVDQILGVGVNPTDKEVEDYFNANRDTLAQGVGRASADLKLSDVRTNILQGLRQQAISNKYQTWIEGLRSRTKIETFVNP